MKASPFSYALLLLLAITVILFIFILQQDPDFFPHRVAGSFEYIRKGEEFLDKGKYIEAIKYFKKAHESSPENETIKMNLVYAYSLYSRALSGENKYDEAIDFLTKSYDITPNASTVQNLAAAYSEKALYEARKGDTAKARDAYAKMRVYASGSDRIAQNIGILLYNDGIAEYKSGREDTAILCLKESLSVSKDSRAFELLADMYYKRAEFRMARFYWHRAKMLNADNKALTEKLKKIAGEMSLAEKEAGDNLPHFEIRYKNDLPIDKELATEMLEKAYADVGKDLAYFPKARTKIFFYSQEDFRNVFRMPYFVKAFYDGSIKMPAPRTRLEKEGFSRYIYHEYAHAVVSAKTNNNCPLWFNEGIALWEEHRDERNTMENFVKGAKRVPDISIHFMENSFKTDEITSDKALSYMLAYTFVDYILDTWGYAGLQGILKRLSKRQHIVNALDDEFLLSEKEFEKRWRDYVLNKYYK